MPNVVDIIVRSKDQTRPGFESAKGGAKGFQGSLQRIGETAAGFLSANLVANAAERVRTFVAGSITEASNLNETMSKTDAVFESSAAGIHAWAANAVDSMGLSKNAAESAADALGLIFTQMGSSSKAAAGMSEKWVQLASDIGSFNNADPTEVLDAMAGSTRGEYDAMQKYVPSISAATVEHEALAMSGKKSATALDAHDKLLAVQKILFEQTTKAQGDFARTGDQNANSQKKAAASMQNAQAALGKGLLPVVTMGAKVMERLGKVMASHPKLIMALAAVAGGILVAAFTAWAISAGTAAVATLAASAPVLAVIAVIGLLVVAAILLARHWRSIWEAVKGAVRAAAGFVASQIDRVISFVKSIPGRVRSALGNLGALLLQAGRNIVQGLIDGIMSKVAAVTSTISSIAGKIRDFLPFSPAKAGPLSGPGSPFKAGQKIAGMIGEGLQAGRGGLGDAMGSLLGAAGPQAPSRARDGRSGGPPVLELHVYVGGRQVAEAMVDPLREAVRSRGGDVQVALGSRTR